MNMLRPASGWPDMLVEVLNPDASICASVGALPSDVGSSGDMVSSAGVDSTSGMSSSALNVAPGPISPASLSASGDGVPLRSTSTTYTASSAALAPPALRQATADESPPAPSGRLHIHAI